MKNKPRLLFLFVFSLTGASLFADIVVLKNGQSEIAGTATGNAREIGVKTPDGVRSIPIDQVLSIRVGPVAPPSEPPASPAARDMTLPAGTAIAVRTIDTIDSKTGDLNKEYAASLDEPIVVDTVVVAPARANAFLRIAEIKQSGKLKGSASLSLRLVAITVNGRRIKIETADVGSQSGGKGGSSTRNVAVGTAAGCGAGAAAAGAVGCGVGAAAGATAGAVVSVLMGKKVVIAPETRLTFTLSQPVVIQEGSVDEPVKRGEAHLKANEFPEALRDYQTALDIDKKSSFVHYSVGRVFLAQGKLQPAANEFREAANGDLDRKWVVVWSHIRLGQVFDRTGQHDRARNEYLLAVQTGDNTDGAQDLAADLMRTPCSVCEDNLTLHDGTVMKGSWLSADDGNVQFLADHKPRVFSKSDVVTVRFGVGEPEAPVPSTAPPVAVLTPEPVRVQAPAAVYGPEPEWLDVVYYREPQGNFIPLERNATRSVQSRTGPFGPNYSWTFYMFEGARSPVRIHQNEKPTFVVRLANGIDPRVYVLYPMDANKNRRAAINDKKTRT